jgi:hypothetical protein
MIGVLSHLFLAMGLELAIIRAGRGRLTPLARAAGGVFLIATGGFVWEFGLQVLLAQVVTTWSPTPSLLQALATEWGAIAAFLIWAIRTRGREDE